MAEFKCNFCGRSQTKVPILILANDKTAGICSTCVGNCVQHMGLLIKESKTAFELPVEEKEG
ncbi:ClpX C4-type zinc finger protein [Providencia huaxiensis]|uniref:ClpX C4-type zinc finger protein n=1 Tax=Providencia huaxiensis TaxID=2027290 RepID=UPI0032DD916C